VRSSVSERVYVDVKAAFNAAGNLMPLEIKWLDGKVFEIDKVTDIRQAAAMKAGGQGDRYTVCIRGKQSYLFFERSGALSGNNLGRWFVEAKAVR
jgi:hypothetical protein